MIYETLYNVILDGELIGIVESEDYVWDLAQDHTNGTPEPLTDDNFCDRVWIEKININRFYVDGKYLCDKLSDISIFYRNNIDAEEDARKLNIENIKIERELARLRAMAL